MARRLNSVCNINFISQIADSLPAPQKMCSSAYRKNKQRGTKVLVKECLKTADKMCCSIKMSLHTFSLIISIILLYISCGASKPQMKSRCSQCLMSRWYTNLGICVSSRATSWGSARVSAHQTTRLWVPSCPARCTGEGSTDNGEAGRNFNTSSTVQFHYWLWVTANMTHSSSRESTVFKKYPG